MFDECDHEGTSNCWETPNFLQLIEKKRRQSSDEENTDYGVIFFGSRERGMVDTVLSRWDL